MATDTETQHLADSYVDDVPVQAAIDAHRGTSFVAERRAEQERQDYSRTLAGDFSRLSALTDTEEKKALLVTEFARYRAGYLSRTMAYLAAKSRCVSTMIAGPANFNVRRANKSNDAADNRSRDLGDFRERALAAIRRTLCPEDAPIMSGDADAPERLAAKIMEAEAKRDKMKALNAEARREGNEVVYTYEITNLGANIRRMKQRLAVIAIAKTKTTTVVQGAGVRLEDAAADNRIRLFFPGKPADDVRSGLKARGFRWTPSLGCWQAYRNQYSLQAAQQFAGIP